MAQFPALPLWTDAYLADTRHLSADQHGAYLLLLMEAWRRPSCSLPDDDEMLARLACVSAERWAANRETIMAFWNLDGRRKEWTQSRLTDERSYVAQKSRSQRDKAINRWKRDRKDDATKMPDGMPNHMPEACPDDAPTPTPTVKEDTTVSSLSEPAVADVGRLKSGKRKGNAYTPEFEAFWGACPSTEGQSKLDGFKAWQKLTPADQAKAAASLPPYADQLKREEGRRVKHVQGYLSSRMFDTLGTASVTELDTPAQWLKRLSYARSKHEWSPEKWGPMPGQSGCRVPNNLLAPGDGEGWATARAA